MRTSKPTLLITFVFLLTSVCNCADAQCPAGMSGVKSIGPTGDYLSLTDAFAATSPNGIQAEVIFELQPAYNSAVETFPITIPQIFCANSSKSITVRPNVDALGLLITSSNTTATIDLNGADFITFDGRPGGLGNSRELTIQNTSSTGSAVRFINDATNNILQYLYAKGQETSALSGVIHFSTTNAIEGNDNNLISFCNIQDAGTTPIHGIFSAGTAGKSNSGNIVSDCNISNFFTADNNSAGIYLAGNNSGWTIAMNNFFQTLPRSINYSTFGLNITSGNSYFINNNNFGFANESQTGKTIISGAGAQLVAYALASENGGSNLLQGNKIAGISIASSRESGFADYAPFIGFLIAGGNVNLVGNTIGSMSVDSTILITGSVANNTWPAAGILVIGRVSQTGAAGTITITNNNIGGIEIVNNGSANGYSFTGISNTSSATSLTIAGNVIGSDSANSIVLGSGIGGQLTGISNMTSGVEISGNTIKNLTNAEINNNHGIAASVIGVLQKSTAGISNISTNLIHTLSNTCASGFPQVIGILNLATQSAGTMVHRNFVHSLTAHSSGNAEIIGFRCEGTVGGDFSSTYQNNMIRLGIDHNGNPVTRNHVVEGISESGGSNNYYHNSVYIGGNGVTTGLNPTSAFHSEVFYDPRNVINNIFVNNRSNGTGSGDHAAIRVETPSGFPAAFKSDYNIFYSGGIGGVVGNSGGVARPTLQSWQISTAQDIHSGVANPGFINPQGDTSTIDLHLMPINPAEGQAVSVTTITDDFDEQSRTAGTDPDIGADEGSFTFNDLFAPVIYFQLQGNAPVSPAPVISARIIDKGSGIHTTGPLAPRIFFRRSSPNPTAWQSQPGTLATGNGNDGFFNFQPVFTGGITLAVGDVIQYYLVAQDQATTPNLGYSANATHTDVNTQVFPPATPHTYSIKQGLPTILDVGNGQPYTSLTGNGGVFQTINESVLSADTEVRIHSDLTEDATHALTATGQNKKSIKIIPGSASLKKISRSGNTPASMIRLLGSAQILFTGG